MATVAVIYPSGPKFDMDYYLSTHMPMVTSTWGPVGLKSWEIVQYSEGGDFQLQALLRWDSLDSWNNAPKEAIIADIAKFTDAHPVLLTGGTKTSHTI